MIIKETQAESDRLSAVNERLILTGEGRMVYKEGLSCIALISNELFILMKERSYTMEDAKLPVYEAPEVITYTDEEIFEKLGPAHTGTLGADRAF